MTLTINFAPDELALLEKKAAETGKDVGTFVHDAAMVSVDRPILSPVLGPIHEATARSGISIDEIDQMADRALAEFRQRSSYAS